MNQELLIATHNPGKLREFRELLAGTPYHLVGLADVGIEKDIEETGATFEENARLKALAYAEQSGRLTLADDSGLEVESLGGEPGILSKRYAGEGTSDMDRIVFLLHKLSDVPDEKRLARFRCVIVIADAHGNTWTGEGTCEGKIAYAPRGLNGFGYDPVFLMAEDNYMHTMAELPEEEKNRVSHRAHAAEEAKRILDRLARAGQDAEGV